MGNTILKRKRKGGKHRKSQSSMFSVSSDDSSTSCSIPRLERIVSDLQQSPVSPNETLVIFDFDWYFFFSYTSSKTSYIFF